MKSRVSPKKMTETDIKQHCIQVRVLQLLPGRTNTHRCRYAETDRPALIEMILCEVCGRHGVCSLEVQQMSATSNDGLLHAGAPTHTKIMKPGSYERTVRTTFPGLLECILHDVSYSPRQGRHRRWIPHLCQEGFQKRTKYIFWF